VGRIILAQLRGRLGRTLALLVGILVATTSFTVLTASARTQRLEVTGTVRHNFRSAYDVLVRPQGSRIGLERERGVVRPNFLSGLSGGISMQQYRSVASIPGVEVAAPIAMVGYMSPTLRLPIDLTQQVAGHGRELLRITPVWVEDRGLTRAADAEQYLYVTDHRLIPSRVSGEPDREVVAGGKSVPVCRYRFRKARGPFDPALRSNLTCVSRGVPLPFSTFSPGRTGVYVYWPFPLLVAGIDPIQEAKLAHLDDAVVRGRYLRVHDTVGTASVGGRSVPAVPVLAPILPYLDQKLVVHVQRLPGSASQDVVRSPISHPGEGALARLIGKSAGTIEIPVDKAYRLLLRQLRGRDPDFADAIDAYWTPGATQYRRHGDRSLEAVATSNPDSVWRSTFRGEGFVAAPMAASDTQFRRLTEHVTSPGVNSDYPVLRSVGEFDPAKLPGFSALSRVPLETYTPPGAVPADAPSRQALGGRDLLPGANLAGYLQSPPLILTTLQGLRAFTSASNAETISRAPISAIRVRVAGVTGVDELSRERVRTVAERIATRVGLDVDITVGSSPSPTTVFLPAGRFGRPELQLREGWIKKGVAVAILTALDRKSLALFTLILLVCAVFVSNAAGAAVRSRRSELGVLACLGWSPARLFVALLGELAVIGLVAGVLGSGLAVAGSRLFGQDVALGRASIAVPSALLLAVLAGTVPAVQASRADPLAAVRPQVSDAHRARRLRSVLGLAWRNVVRTPGRSALAATALAIGTAALSVLLAVTFAFQGVVVGSLLGDAVSVQVRAGDLFGVIAIVLLGAAAVADVLFLGVRERATELSTLRVTGWDESVLQRLVGFEAAFIGLAGSLAGALFGVAGAAALSGTVPGAVWRIAPLVVLAGTATTMVAAAIPVLLLRYLPTTELLAEE
jgi:ABC-type antimicrobial peptide transport system permease subunit